MESRIEKLFDAIVCKEEYWLKQKEIFGENSIVVQSTSHELIGMSEAFEIISGMPLGQYIIENLKA